MGSDTDALSRPLVLYVDTKGTFNVSIRHTGSSTDCVRHGML